MLLLAMCGGGFAEAQEAGPGRLSPQLADALAKVRPGSTLRISVAGQRSRAVFTGSTESLTVAGADGRVTVPLAAVDSVWRRGRHTKTGAIVGGVVGAAGGIALASVLRVVCECERTGYFYPALGLGGAAAGALVGGVVGAAIPRWARVYP